MNPVDPHTLSELQIVSEHHRSAGILNYFDQTKTYGGRDYLKKMICEPPATLTALLSFQDLLKTIVSNPISWEIDIPRAYVMAAENYYTLNIAHSMSQDVFKHWFDTLIFSFRNPAEFSRIQSGLMAVLKLIRAVNKMLKALEETEIPREIAGEISDMRKFLSHAAIKSLLTQKDENLSNRSVFHLDYFFRVEHKKALRHFLDVFYKFDAYLAIAKTAVVNNLSFPEIRADIADFNAESVWHPLVANAVSNHFELVSAKPVCILTGANTSGKTTFLKTCGIVVYLAHLGWPVPAEKVKLPYVDRLFTSIHLSDDLDLGYSHFYNEMMRIKSIATALNEDEKCFVIIDELFRGTNQDDALHCSRTAVDGFSNFKGSLFIVSTHLLELIKNYSTSPQVSFKCFKTRITGMQFENSYRIEDGVAYEKVGRLIMIKSGVEALLKKQKRLPDI
ncbi:MutS-related protein [Dyadobacter sp. CY323]|uniref:MutS-related protein n=1 Tax=Dyadobacter sp. CY323 TaxID=2907302 RepID=UPI001F445157|nr:DNA mismatch repair protein MutS [Dyadobacter sp. CY323]MCE6989147.1 DNA mismatch repair protein MutS [Dyadobacter sp. CY323]